MSSSALIDIFGQPGVTYRRFLAGAYTDGVWTDGAEAFVPTQSEVQALVGTAPAVMDAGALDLEFNGFSTGPVAFVDLGNPNLDLATWALALEAALEALPSIGAGNINVVAGYSGTGPIEFAINLQFSNALADTPLPLMTIVSQSFTYQGTPITLSVARFQAGVAPNTLFTMTASIQPVQGRERDLLPEGQRTREVVKIYTTTLLTPANEQAKTKGDRVEWQGRQFDVFDVETWTDEKDLPHYKALATLVEVD